MVNARNNMRGVVIGSLVLMASFAAHGKCFEPDKAIMVAPKGSSSAWAGRVVQVCGNEGSYGAVTYKIEIQWRTDESQYRCGQVITKSEDETKDFTKRSFYLKQCN